MFYQRSCNDPIHFTRREKDILDWLMMDKIVTQIAQQLGFSESTVVRHVRKIKRKLNCKTLFELGYKIQRMGLDKVL